MPCDRQACENAQVVQKCSASPSSDRTLRVQPRERQIAHRWLRWRTPARRVGIRSRGRSAAGRRVRAGPGIGRSTSRCYAIAAVLARWPRCGPARSAPGRRRPAAAGAPARRRNSPRSDVVAALQRGHRDLALAHQLLDQVGAQLVVLAQAHAAEHRQAAGVDRRFPAGQVARVLAEAVADMADRADAQADQVAVGVGGVAHEVAMQAAARLRLRQVVVGQGEVVHADVDVAGGGELLDRQLQQRQLGLGVRQQVFGSICFCGLNSCGRCA